MQDGYRELLEASMDHLQALKAKGHRFIPVEQEIWAKLCAKLPASTPAAVSIFTTAAQSPFAPVTPLKPAPRPAECLASASAAPQSPPAVAPPIFNTCSSQPAPPPVILAGAAKTAAMQALRERALACTKCAHLAASRHSVVFGVGSIDSTIMFVGEAPGADEDQAGEPFVGKAGQLLTKIIETMGLARSGVYIANILKCRPDTPGQAYGNRKPTPGEMAACVPFLHEQIDLIRPKVLIALGSTAVEGLLGGPVFITKMRGKWQTYRGTPLMPTYHPAYVLRNQALSVKREIWEDMLQVMERAGMPISEKQRGFFLKA